MSEQITRGKWLTAFLLVAFFGGLGIAASYIFSGHKIAPEYPAWIIYLLATTATLRVISVLAIWFWSKSGVVAYILLSVIAVPVLLSVGVKASLFGGIVGTVILITLTHKKWQFMSWGLSKFPVVASNLTHHSSGTPNGAP
jgi:hypothetical protein